MISVILEEGVELPKYESELASGLDVKVVSILKAFKGDKEVEADRLEKMRESFERGTFKMRGFERVLFGTGITIADMPSSLEIQVRDRSGIALKRGLLIANSPGTVDADYRGQIGLIIVNSTPYLSKVEKGERLAQLVPAFTCREEFGRSTEIIPTERGDGAYNSTGTK